MKKNLLIIVALICFLCVTDIYAQSHSQTSSRKWKGIDLQEWYDNHQAGQSEPIYLYNVGTGLFVIDGGDWGMEARLFHEDFGRMMNLKIENYSGNKDLKIEPDITEHNASGANQYKRQLTCNIPTVTRSETWTTAYNACSVTTILDGFSYFGKWRFQRVETDPNSQFHTYYLYQQHDVDSAYTMAYTKTYLGKNIKNIKFWLGAAYGEYCSDGTTTFKDKNGNVTGTNEKGCGYYVNVDDDRSCWTSAGSPNNTEQSPVGNPTVVNVNGNNVTIDELYQWRVISRQEFLEVLNKEVIGINPSISSLVPDRDFTRNSEDFFDNWLVTPAPDVTQGDGEGRYGYTWGQITLNTQQSKYNNEAWDAPVRLKKVFGSLKTAKYGFMSFEGRGTLHATFVLPEPGWYQIEAAAINFSSDPTHLGYLYAQAGYVADEDVTEDIKENPANAYQGYARVDLLQMTGTQQLFDEYSSIFRDMNINGSKAKNSENANIAVGNALTRKTDDFCRSVWVYIDPTKFALGGVNKMLTIGFEKIGAIQVRGGTNGGKTYYYDADWTCIDDIRVSYMGLAPAFFYEEEESLDYLIFDQDLIDERPSATVDGLYSGALSLERTMKKDEWNSFSFPIPLSGEQVRKAFGEDVQLLVLDGIYKNGVDQPYFINFVTVDTKIPVIDDENVPAVIEPGKFYLIKPTLDPLWGEDPMGKMAQFYDLGRNFFAASTQQRPAQLPTGYSHTVIDADHPYASLALTPSADGENQAWSFVSYVRTRGMYKPDGTKKDPSLFLDKDGIYNGNDIDPSTEYLFVPKGGYAVATKNGKQVFMEVNKDTPLKGFRAWLTLEKSLFTHDDVELNKPSQIMMLINSAPDNDNTITRIDGQDLNPNIIMNGKDVYDLSGRIVGTYGTTPLSKGVYIVAGKKIYVK